VLEYVRGTGLRVYIEPAHRFESNQILTLDDGLRMIREIGDPQLGILLDTGHLHVNGEDLAEGVGKLGPLLGHVDLDDNDGSADAHLAPGAGTIDFTGFPAALKQADYSGYVAAELGMQYVLDPDPVVASCLDWMKHAFGDSPSETFEVFETSKVQIVG
jgi:D-psicose/D-tagatose/L-ribulose 3-epimerase